MTDPHAIPDGFTTTVMHGVEHKGQPFHQSLGKVLAQARIEEDPKKLLRFTFTDGSQCTVSDEGQSCCEYRYMRTDDNLTEYDGATLLGVSLKDAPNIEDDGECHEVQFLEVITSAGSFVVSSHNEHNGGFNLCVVEE